MHEQRCNCLCEAVSLHGGTRAGSAWANVTEADFQAILDADSLL